jgi:dolichol-phosphate mannosyltransferase
MEDKPSSRPWVIVPTYNEAENIVDFCEAVLSSVPEARILVVDDSSPDGTADLVKENYAPESRVELMIRPAKSGLGSAYREGFRYAIASGATAVIEIDADFSHDPAVIPYLLSALDDGAGLAIGSRYVRGGSSPGLGPLRLAISRGGNLYAKWTLGLKAQDITAGFRAYRREVIENLDLEAIKAEGYGFQVEMAYRVAEMGFPIVEIPIEFHNRRAGTSKMSARIVLEAMVLCTAWGLARRAPTTAKSVERFVDRFIAMANRTDELRQGSR